jgi:hypothetical protein
MLSGSALTRHYVLILRVGVAVRALKRVQPIKDTRIYTRIELPRE